MGLFDEIAGGIAGKLFGGGDKNKLFECITSLINNPQSGGLDGLLETFKTKGLGDIFSSWVSTGENMPITNEQVRHALGSEQLQKIAEHAGISKDSVSQGLASLFPEIVDKLTPNGTIPRGEMLAQGLNLLKDKFLKAWLFLTLKDRFLHIGEEPYHWMAKEHNHKTWYRTGIRVPYRTSKRHFEELAGEALKGIPVNYQKFFRNIVVIVEDFPDVTLAKQMGIPRTALLGLFRGQPQGNKDSFFSIPSPYPDTIYLYQNNIEAGCNSEEDLKEEIRRTIFHEVGHYFGLSEDDLQKLENSG